MTETISWWAQWRDRLRSYLAPRADTEMVVVWWELRRVRYNLILLSWLALNLIGWSAASGLRRFYDHTHHPGGASLGDWKYDVLLCAAWGVVLQITANFWYCGGWLADVLCSKLTGGRAKRFGPWALALGTIFSLFFAEWFYSATLADRVF